MYWKSYEGTSHRSIPWKRSLFCASCKQIQFPSSYNCSDLQGTSRTTARTCREHLVQLLRLAGNISYICSDLQGTSRTTARTCREHLLVSTVCRGSPLRGKELQARWPLGRYMCQGVWSCRLQCSVERIYFFTWLDNFSTVYEADLMCVQSTFRLL
jgi:hypothetical protein